MNLQECTMRLLKESNSLDSLTRALSSNNIPYILKRDRILLDFNNKNYLKQKSIDKDRIILNTDGTVRVICSINPDYLKTLSTKDQQLFLDNGQSKISNLNNINPDEYLLDIINTLKVVNNYYISNQQKNTGIEIPYDKLSNYIRPLIEIAYDNKYNTEDYDKESISKIKEYCKDVELIKKVIDYIGTII